MTPNTCADAGCTGSAIPGSVYCLDCNGLVPDGATVEPWTDADTADLAAAMSEAAHARRERWTGAQWGARHWRRGRIAWRVNFADDRGAFALLTLRRAAAMGGLVPDLERLDADAFDDRRRELLDVWQHTATARDEAAYAPSGARFYEDSDGFEERAALANPAAYGRADGWPPIYTAGAIASGAFD